MDNARRWMSLDDQPPIAFGGRRLNNYIAAWPLPSGLRPPENPLSARSLGTLPANGIWTLRQIGYDQCCRRWWWHPTDPDLLYVIDGTAAQRAAVFSWSAQQGGMTAVIRPAPPAVTSPDAAYEIDNRAGQVYVRRVADNGEVAVPTQGNTPAISADNSYLMWTERGGNSLPGQAFTSSEIWVSNLDGSEARIILSQPGASAQWLDGSRLLLRVPDEGRITNLHVTDVRDETGTIFTLGTWRNMRSLSVAPGGERLMFYIMWQDNPADDGIYVIDTAGGSPAQRLPLFGSWRWRDADSVFFLMFEPGNPFHTFAYYNVTTGDTHILQTPPGTEFTVMNGEWEVSADGRSIVFQNALDGNMWLLELTG
jgi:hypothetical protein